MRNLVYLKSRDTLNHVTILFLITTFHTFFISGTLRELFFLSHELIFQINSKSSATLAYCLAILYIVYKLQGFKPIILYI
jgi:hypothetical protein